MDAFASQGLAGEGGGKVFEPKTDSEQVTPQLLLKPGLCTATIARFHCRAAVSSVIVA